MARWHSCLAVTYSLVHLMCSTEHVSCDAAAMPLPERILKDSISNLQQRVKDKDYVQQEPSSRSNEESVKKDSQSHTHRQQNRGRALRYLSSPVFTWQEWWTGMWSFRKWWLCHTTRPLSFPLQSKMSHCSVPSLAGMSLKSLLLNYGHEAECVCLAANWTCIPSINESNFT